MQGHFIQSPLCLFLMGFRIPTPDAFCVLQAMGFRCLLSQQTPTSVMTQTFAVV